jgi:hypothetical protein
MGVANGDSSIACPAKTGPWELFLQIQSVYRLCWSIVSKVGDFVCKSRPTTTATDSTSLGQALCKTSFMGHRSAN